MPTAFAQPPARFTYVDALRGLAALLVAGFHYYPGISDHYRVSPFGEPFHTVLLHGNCGVDVFFVLSGFVIAYTVREARITPRYLGNFVLRRSVRLEPPYWVTIVLALGALGVANLVRTDRTVPWPTAPQLLAHLVYLQDVLRLGNILEVFWTLCFEVQFYLTFILLDGLAQYAGRRLGLGPGGLTRLRLGLFAPLTAWSFAIQGQLLVCPHGLMIKCWYLFFLGVLAWWALNGQVKPAHFWCYAAALLALVTLRFTAHNAVGLLTGVSLFLVGSWGRLDTWLAHRPLQYLGRISYSLYLIHTVVGDPIVYYFRQQLVGPVPSPAVGLALFATACTVSVGAAHAMYRLVERPSVEFAKRLKARG